jgi:hypothetical protein
MTETKEPTKAQKIIEILATGPKDIPAIHAAIGGRVEGERPYGATYGLLREMRLQGLITKAPVMFQLSENP